MPPPADARCNAEAGRAGRGARSTDSDPAAGDALIAEAKALDAKRQDVNAVLSYLNRLMLNGVPNSEARERLDFYLRGVIFYGERPEAVAPWRAAIAALMSDADAASPVRR